MDITVVPGFNPGPYTGAGNNTYVISGEIPTLVDAATGEAAHLRALADALAPERMLPAHGQAIDDPAVVMSQHLEHRQRREDQIVAALRAGDRRPDAIVDRLYEGLDPELKQLAQESVVAHLVKLQDEGRARSDGEEWELS